MSEEPTVAVMPPHAEFCDWSLSDDPCNCGLDDFITTMVAQARLDGRCASCGEPATTTSRPNGRLTLVCLRHYNVWKTPASIYSRPHCGRLDAHSPHKWSTPYSGPYGCDGAPVTEGGWTRCPGCGTSGPPHPVGGGECRETAREKAISQGDV